MTPMRLSTVLAIAFAATLPAFPQTRAFEVASIRVQPGPVGNIGVYIAGTRLEGKAERVVGLIMYAWHVEGYQVDRSPGVPSISDVMYDIVAKPEGDTVPTADEFRQMMQKLLLDRFHLKIHKEMREMPVYALVVGKNGSKLKPSSPDADPQVHLNASGSNYQYFQVLMPLATMDDLAKNLNGAADHPVLDKTGITGTWDIKLNYTPAFKLGRSPEPDPNELTIFAAVQDQLGLRLEPQKAMVEVIVVDHVESPSEN